MTSALSVPCHPTVPAAVSAPICPFHDGVATLDLLLAELDPRETSLFDAVLDLRSLATAGTDALKCLEQFFRVRALLAGRHYLAFYRVRHWARQTFRIQARSARGAAWATQPLPLDCARIDEAVNGALATLADQDALPTSAHVRFAFAAADR
jgi:hypothetical protein